MTDEERTPRRLGTAYIPEGETRTLEFIDDWLAYHSGTLYLRCSMDELDSDRPVLLEQYSAEDLYLPIRKHQPDPGERVRVSNEGAGFYRVEWNPEEVESAADAMDGSDSD